MAKALFKREDVIEKATGLFWEHGYCASSMQQIVETTGLKPGSIYHSFGNKESLFAEVLESYASIRMEQMSRVLEQAPSVGEGICTVLKGVAEESTRENFCSCLLVKTQLELAGDSGEQKLYRLASERLQAVEAMFRRHLEKEYSPEVSRLRATSIMLHIFGMRVYGYHQGAVERMLPALKGGLPWLPWESRPE